MTKTVNKKQTNATQTTQKVNVITNMQGIYDYVNALAKNNNKIALKAVTGYVALKYANKTICELHDKKRSIAHITISNTSKAFTILKNANAVTRVVAASYGWRLNTECLLKAECLSVITQVIDTLIAETEQEFNAKEQKQTKEQKQA